MKSGTLNVVVAGLDGLNRARRQKGLPALDAPTTFDRVPGIPATPANDLQYHGGRLLTKISFVTLYLGGPAFSAVETRSINGALTAALADQGLNNVMAQYMPNGNVDSEMAASFVVVGRHPAEVFQNDIEAFLTKLYRRGALTSFALDSTIFCFILPKGVILSGANRPSTVQVGRSREDAPDSLHGLGGYHGAIAVGGTTIYYAIAVYSQERPAGPNGIPVFSPDWKNIVATLYHEIEEARTDVDVEQGNATHNDKLFGWLDKDGNEVGDLPINEANPLTQVFQEVDLSNGRGRVPVQFMYSNAVHGPEGPISAPRTPLLPQLVKTRARSTTGTGYDRNAAAAYARKYWNVPTSDGYVAGQFTHSSTPDYQQVPAGTVYVHTNDPSEPENAQLPDSSTIPWANLDDCTHFISCCVGTPPGDTAGGLTLPYRDFPGGPYGVLGARRFVDMLVAPVNRRTGQPLAAMAVSLDAPARQLRFVPATNQAINVARKRRDDATNPTDRAAAQADLRAAARAYVRELQRAYVDRLQPGDLIAYARGQYQHIHHNAMYLGNVNIACHTYCRCDNQSDGTGWNSTGQTCDWDHWWYLGLGSSVDYYCFIQIND